MIETLNIDQIKAMFRGGAQNLALNKAYIDSLNVFPVPDGDTGTNMNLTMASTIREMEGAESDRTADVCQAIARGALKGARGNSGVILSQIFKGVSAELAEAKAITPKIFARALKNGSNVAYDVVTRPKEGTILTVIRLMSDYALKAASRKEDFLAFFPAILKKGEEVLQKTPDMLPVLKKAGVVDAGGRGLLVILTGMYNVLAGVEMQKLEEETPSAEQEIDVADPEIHNLEDIKFAYCTEFFIINLHKKTTMADIDKLREKLGKIGDCVLVVGDLQLVKIHVHTNNPGKALEYALQLGELERPKIENMLEQHRALQNGKKSAEVPEPKAAPAVRPEPIKEAGMVAICTGSGLKSIFGELGVDLVIEGGQTMNPSVDDIVNAVDSVPANTVYILPNNSNIVLAAEQAKELTKAKLVVIATKNIPQGIAAAISFDPDGTPEQNVEAMSAAAARVRSGQVTHAVRETEMDGFMLKNGDIIGIYHGVIVAKGDEIAAVTRDVIDKMTDDDTASITLYYGEGVTEADAEELVASVQEDYPFYDVVACRGGQNHYYYYISVE